MRVDQKGRLLIPQRDREALGVRPGDAFFVELEGQVLRYAKAPTRWPVRRSRSTGLDGRGSCATCWLTHPPRSMTSQRYSVESTRAAEKEAVSLNQLSSTSTVECRVNTTRLRNP